MRSVLVHAESWKVIGGQRPAANAESWDVLDEKALAMMTLSVRPSQLCYLKNCTTAASAWKKLKEVQQPSGPVRKVSLYKQLLVLRMKDGEAMPSYLNKFCSTIGKLSEVDIKLSEELAVIILLSSLPKNYENFVIAIETRDSFPSLEVLKIKLLEEGERRGSESKSE